VSSRALVAIDRSVLARARSVDLSLARSGMLKVDLGGGARPRVLFMYFTNTYTYGSGGEGPPCYIVLAMVSLGLVLCHWPVGEFFIFLLF
jgi:hypothetical protein